MKAREVAVMFLEKEFESKNAEIYYLEQLLTLAFQEGVTAARQQVIHFLTPKGSNETVKQTDS